MHMYIYIYIYSKLVSQRNEALPYKRVCYNILQSMLFKVLATVYLLSLNTGHRRKNERSIQYSNYNYKEDLNNFGSCTRILL